MSAREVGVWGGVWSAYGSVPHLMFRKLYLLTKKPLDVGLLDVGCFFALAREATTRKKAWTRSHGFWNRQDLVKRSTKTIGSKLVIFSCTLEFIFIGRKEALPPTIFVKKKAGKL